MKLLSLKRLWRGTSPKTILQTRWGIRKAEPDLENMRAALTELSIPDPEHPSAWLEDQNGWGLVVFEAGRVVLLAPDSKEIGRRQPVTFDEALELWSLLQQQRLDEIKRRLACRPVESSLEARIVANRG